MKSEDLVKLNVNSRSREKFDKYIKPHLPAIKEQSIEYGRLIPPIIIWRKGKVEEIVYGGLYVEIIREKPTIDFTVIYRDYKDWVEADADITTYACTFEELSSWDKLVLCLDCDEYWYDVEMAKQNKGKRTDLDTDAESKFKTHKVNEIIGKKVGVSATVVSNFKTIYLTGSEDLKKKCAEGLGITTAYKMLRPEKGKNGADKKTDKPKDKKETQLEVMKNCNLFAECEKLPPSKKKAANLVHDDKDYKVIVDKIRHAKLPAGRLWIAIGKDKGTLHVASNTYDEAAGKVQVKVDCFDCNFMESVDGLYIFEADFAFGPEKYNFKDETDFESAVKTDSHEVPQ